MVGKKIKMVKRYLIYEEEKHYLRVITCVSNSY